MKESKKAEEVAGNRFKAITPVLLAIEEKADVAKLAQVKRAVCEQNGISRRTLGRWLAEHDNKGFDGLKPKPKTYSGSKVLSEELIQEAIMLRREVPMRSVPTIIEILELEGKAPKGLIKESTLHEKLMERGYSARHMKLYQQTGTASRRFQRQERNDMWQADIKFAAYIPAAGGKKQTYMVAFIDDATRYVVHAEFYDSLEQVIVEDCLRKAITKYGLPSRLFFDNGGQFRNKWMEMTCAKLGIKLLFARPYSPESSGKIERFNRTVDSFLAEAALQKLTTLDGYNHYFKVWLQECYHTKDHAALNDTPLNVYQKSKAPIRFADPVVLADAFLHSETRKVDKSGCISLNNRLYDVGLPLIGQRVEVLYDPADIRTITVKHGPTQFEKRVQELVIGAHAAPRPKLPDTLLPEPAQSSRLLDAKNSIYEHTHQQKRNAIRYSAFEGNSPDKAAGGDCGV